MSRYILCGGSGIPDGGADDILAVEEDADRCLSYFKILQNNGVELSWAHIARMDDLGRVDFVYRWEYEMVHPHWKCYDIE